MCIFYLILNLSQADQKNSKIKGWQYRSGDLSRAIFLPTKSHTDFTWNFLHLAVQVYRGTLIPNLKINVPFLCYPFFFKYINPAIRINKIVKKHTANYHPGLSVYETCNPTMVGENFQVNWLLKIAFMSQKIKSSHFYSCHPARTLPQVLIITTQAERNYSKEGG